MSGEPLSDDELFPLFEAARWAPSSYNAQPWRFIYAKRETEAWRALFELLVPFNQSWVENASVLVVIASHTVFEKSGSLHQLIALIRGLRGKILPLKGRHVTL